MDTEERIQPGKRLKIILFWNNWIPLMGNTPLLDGLCPVTSCIFSPDQSLFNHSDVVLFFDNYETSIRSLPHYRQRNQLFVFAVDNMLQPSSNQSTSSNSLVNNRRTRFSFFNRTMTHRRDSDIVLRHSLGAVVPIKSANPSVKVKHKTKIASSRHWMKKPSALAKATFQIGSKTKLIAWLPSSCSTSNRREEYVSHLSQFVPVDIYGSCGSGNLTCGDVGTCEDDFRVNYKFYLAFEESWCPDYITTEFYKALEYDIVPIVFGGADYNKLAPPHSFINAQDFTSVKSLADYILLLNRTDELYAKYFLWKENYEVSLKPMSGWCDLCRIAHNDNLPTKVYEDIRKWWGVDGKCEHDSTKYFP